MMTNAVFVMTGFGFCAGICLAIAWYFFNVEEDPDLERIRNALPGINCGGCGYIGCADAAKALLEGKAPVTVCVAGGFEVVSKLSTILDLTPPFTGPALAASGCTGGTRAETRFFYRGIRDCRAEHLFYGGSKVCENGCLGHGSCVAVCMFNAIRLTPHRTPIICEERCKGCGKCVDICPVGVLSLTGLTEKLLHLNRKDECLAPCRQKCPAQVDIPRMIRHIREKKFSKALMTIKERNPLPLSTGRVCSHPCENICRRNIADQGVAICQLGRFLSELPLAAGHHEKLSCLPDTHRLIAVVGGGPAGLSCAYFLRRLGHRPVIFEKRSRLGGMLRYGIPEYRLPKHLVDTDIQGILELGVQVKPNMTLGKDVTLNQLRDQGFQAVFLGIGAWQVPALCIDGEYLDQVIQSLDFLSQVGAEITDLSGVEVAVIGESNTAMDCARSCIRLKAASVTIICPAVQKMMSARKRDVTRAMEEGVDILFSTTPTRVLFDPKHHVTGLEYCKVAPVEKKTAGMGEKIQGSETSMKASLVISAYERKPHIDFLLKEEIAGYEFRASDKFTLAADKETLLASAPNVFAAGDLYTGRASVVQAVAGGRMAARSIHYFLAQGSIPFDPGIQKRLNPKSILKNITVADHPEKVIVKELDVNLRKQSFMEEVLGTISRDQAVAEAMRCLRCGTLCNDK